MAGAFVRVVSVFRYPNRPGGAYGRRQSGDTRRRSNEYESDSLGIISLFSANVSEASFNIKVEQIQHKGARLGSRSYRVRGYKQGRGWEAVPTGLSLKVV